jgi:hypothetical protein
MLLSSATLENSGRFRLGPVILRLLMHKIRTPVPGRGILKPMHSNLSTRSLLLALAVLTLAACAYYFFPASNWSGGGQNKNAPPLTVEQKAEILHSLTQTENAGTPAAPTVTPEEAAARLRTLKNVAQSSSDSPAAQQSDADKLKVLRSLQSQ